MSNTRDISHWYRHDSYNFFQKFNLEAVPIETSQLLTTYDEVCDYLLGAFEKIKTKTIAEAGAGNVFTFVKRSGNNDDSVVSMCKLKSVESTAINLIFDVLKTSIEKQQVDNQFD